MLNTETDSKCRLYQQFEETIDHIISACPILAKEQYVKKHDSVCVHNYTSAYARKQGYNWTKTGVQLDKKHWYEHVPKSVETSQGGKVTMLWN